MQTLYECLDLGVVVGEQLNNSLVKSLTLEESRTNSQRREHVGFLG